MVKISKFHFSYQLIYHTHPSVSHTGARRVLYHYLHISRVLMLPLSTPSKNEKKHVWYMGALIYVTLIFIPIYWSMRYSMVTDGQIDVLITLFIKNIRVIESRFIQRINRDSITLQSPDLSFEYGTLKTHYCIEICCFSQTKLNLMG